MTPTTLQALRRLLFFSAPEAARQIGGVTERSWRMWEDGSRPVPADVTETVLRLTEWRSRAIRAGLAAIDDAVKRMPRNETRDITLVWYASVDDWMTLPDREPEFWRPHCSVIAHVAAINAAIVEVVAFDAPAYANWLRGRRDSELMRAEWAGSQPLK